MSAHSAVSPAHPTHDEPRRPWPGFALMIATDESCEEFARRLGPETSHRVLCEKRSPGARSQDGHPAPAAAPVDAISSNAVAADIGSEAAAAHGVMRDQAASTISTELPASSEARSAEPDTLRSASETVRVDIRKLDELMRVCIWTWCVLQRA